MFRYNVMRRSIHFSSALSLAAGIFILGAGTFAVSCASGRETAKSAVEAVTAPTADFGKILTGQAAFGDWSSDAPGVKRQITVNDLPKPYATESSRNGPHGVGRPAGAMPKVPDGFTVNEFAQGLNNPRYVQTAPNGDIFVVESGPGRVKVLRDTDGDGKADTTTVFAEGLKRPFGLAFYPTNTDKPTHVYVGNTDSVVRFPYTAGDSKATAPAELLVNNIPSGNEQVGGGGHWTRDIAFSKDNKRMFVSVGSRSNVSDDASETRRACILSFTPDGKKLLISTDEGNEFSYVKAYDLATGQSTVLDKANWDISADYLSHKGRYRVLSVNNDARTELWRRNGRDNCR